MNREIKFRIWDKVENKYIFITKREDYDWLAVAVEHPELYDVQQFTGLLDKQSKEIYEGDIVKGGVYYGWVNEKGIGVIKFGEWEQDGSGHEYSTQTCFGWYINVKESQFYNEDSFLDKEKCKFLEVIGNIYENPELLTPPSNRGIK